MTRRDPVVDLPARVDALRAALDTGSRRLDPTAVDETRRVLERTGERLRLGAGHTVVALGGATGSGKSSLFNALAGLELATVGARRPTTSTPSACVWGPGGEALLDWLDVPRRHRTERESALDAAHESDLAGLVLLDLPDHDSTRVEHRVEVDRMVALVDLLVWVVDPQKYADQALHAGYLRDLGDHDAVTLLVLNQVDTLAAADVEACRRDLRRLLAADGLADVRVLTTSALTGNGVADLRAHVAATVAARSAVEDRARADLVRSARALRAGVGDSEPDPDGGVGREQLVDVLADAAGVPAVVRAVDADHRRRAAGYVGWPFTRWLRRLRPDPLRRLRLSGVGSAELIRMTRSSLPEPTQTQRARVGLATRRVAQGASQGLPPRWAGAVREAADPGGENLSDALDQAVTGVDLQQRTSWWWPVAGALQVLLAVAAVAGLAWLVTLGVLTWLRVPEPPVPDLGPLPWPTVLLLGGLLGGVLLAVLGRVLAGIGARRRGRRVGRALRRQVAGVAEARVLDPVAAVLADHARTRELLDAAPR